MQSSELETVVRVAWVIHAFLALRFYGGVALGGIFKHTVRLITLLSGVYSSDPLWLTVSLFEENLPTLIFLEGNCFTNHAIPLD